MKKINQEVLNKVESMSNEEVADYLEMKNPKKVCWELARQRVAEQLQDNADLNSNFIKHFRF